MLAALGGMIAMNSHLNLLLPLYLAGLLFLSLPHPASHASSGDHDRARAALEAGQILPLSQILAALEKTQPGQVIEVELERDGNQWIYEIKLLQKNGHRQKIKMDASNANIISNKVK